MYIVQLKPKQLSILLPLNLSQSSRIAVKVEGIIISAMNQKKFQQKTHRNEVKVFVVVLLKVGFHPELNMLRKQIMMVKQMQTYLQHCMAL